MAKIRPFKGYTYNKDKISDMSNVVVPLKYNMTDEEKSKFYEMDEYNISRIFDGKSYPSDTGKSNKYSRAAEYLDQWIKDGVIVCDEEDAIYLYEEVIEMHGNTYSNTTFVALLELEELGEANIHSCEEIRQLSKKDRYDLLAATKTDLSMISCLYVERGKKLLNIMNEQRESEPYLEFVMPDGLTQRLWKITDKALMDEITEEFKDLPLYITDGQTRYSTCVKYRNYMRENDPEVTGDEAYNYAMVSLFNSNSDGVVIMPEHRAIKLPDGFSEELFVALIQDHFKIEKIIVDAQDDSITETMKKQIMTRRQQSIFAVYQDSNYFYRITLTDPDYIKKELLPDMSEAYCGLDTVVLRKLIINDVLGIKDDYDELVSTSVSSRECYNAVQRGDADVMIAMNPVKVEQIESVTAAGETMPFRTVSMFPKPFVGTLMYIKSDK